MNPGVNPQNTSGQSRLAQVFLWKEGSAPTLQYARQVLSVVNPETYRAVLGENPPIQLFSVIGDWPADMWPRALADMRPLRAPDGTQWADTNRYDLAGWQGTDRRTGDRLFIVTAYRRAEAGGAAFSGSGVGAPTPSQLSSPGPTAQVPIYPQYPTGSLVWPPTPLDASSQGQLQAAQPTGYPYPAAYPQLPAPGAYPYGYNPLVTGPLPTLPSAAPLGATGPLAMIPVPFQGGYVPLEITLPESYAPFYASFGSRASAALLDLLFVALLQVITLLVFLLNAPPSPPGDLVGWTAAYGPFVCLALGIAVAYHVALWSLWGQTVGKKLLGVKVVTADGRTPGAGRSLLRAFGYFLSFSLAGWGFWLAALDARRQALHDKMAETFVVPEHPRQPAPVYLPGYRREVPPVAGAGPGGLSEPLSTQTGRLASTLPTTSGVPVGMAAVGTQQPYGVVQIAPAAQPADSFLGVPGATGGQQAGEAPSETPEPGPTQPSRALAEQAAGRPPPPMPTGTGITTLPNLPEIPTGPVTEILLGQGGAGSADQPSVHEKAREYFKAGLAAMERGVRTPLRGAGIDPAAARDAAREFKQAIELVPNSVAYRYYYAVSLRYAEGFEVAINEFRQVLERDPSHYEARQQVSYGQRWHDAFAYPGWLTPAPVEVGQPLPEPVRQLLPPGRESGTRLAILREGASKVVSVLSRTRRKDWAAPPNTEMPARLHLLLSRTPHGPIICVYVIVEDNPEEPFIGETFLNPHDPGSPTDDACQLGQHMLEQLARQDRTFLIFVDESNNLLLSRKLIFDASTHVTVARVLYEVQSLPPQVMNPDRFKQAAQWHMEHFTLDQVRGK